MLAGSELEAGVLDAGVLEAGVLEEGVSVLEQPARIAITMHRHRTIAISFFILFHPFIIILIGLFAVGSPQKRQTKSALFGRIARNRICKNDIANSHIYYTANGPEKQAQKGKK